MLPRMLRLHWKTHSRLVRLSKEAERDASCTVSFCGRLVDIFMNC